MELRYTHVEMVIFLFNLTLGYVVWTYNSKSYLNRILTFLIICILFIDISHILSLQSSKRDFLETSVTLGSLGISFFFPVLYTLSLYYPIKRDLKARHLYLLYGLTTVLSLAAILTFKLFDLPLESGAISFRNIPVPFVVFYFLLTSYSLGLLFLTTRNFIHSYRKPIIPYEKRTIGMLASFGFPLGYALSVVVWMDFFFKILFPWVSLLLALFTSFIVILIFRFHVVDLRRFVDRIFFFPSIAAILVLVYTSSILSNQATIARHLSLPEDIALVLEVIIIYMAVSMLRKVTDIPFIKARLSKLLLFRSVHIEPFEYLSYAVTLEELFKRLQAVFKEYGRIENLMLLLFDEKSGRFVNVDGEHPFELDARSPLIRVLGKLNRGITLEELLIYLNEREEIQLLHSHGINLILPVPREGELTALILLPKRSFFRSWSFQDIVSLNYLRVIIPSLIDRCKMYEIEKALEKHESRMEQLNVIGQMASELAHEIRNPLSIISASVETILKNQAKAGDRKRMLQFIQEETQRLNVLANRMLSINFQRRPEFVRFDLNALFERLRDFLQYKLKDKGITFSIKGAESLFLHSDPNVLFQILLNVTMNSIEALGDGGLVEISCARDDSKVSITLSDDGPGIPSELHGRIFEPFFTTKKNGSGLGLAVSRKLVETLFGSIDLLPSRRGASFKIALPILNLKV